MKGRLAFAVLVLAGSGLMNGSPVSAEDAQVSAAVYARAEAVIPQHIGKLIVLLSTAVGWVLLPLTWLRDQIQASGRPVWADLFATAVIVSGLLFWLGGGVSGSAKEFYIQCLAGKCPGGSNIACPRVHYHGGIDIVKSSICHHYYFATV